MKIVAIFLCIIFSVFLGYRNIHDAYFYESTNYEMTASVSKNIENKEYNVFYENTNYIQAPLEPKSPYLGAYLNDTTNKYDEVTKFNEITNNAHNIYSKTLKIGEAFPFTWFYEVLSLNKIPKIELVQPNIHSTLDVNDLIYFSKQLGELKIPVFVDFMPVEDINNLKPEKYISYYKEVRELFYKNAPNVAFIWSIGMEDIHSDLKFYPGNEFVDWVGLNIFSNADDIFDDIFWNNFEFFYFTFQKVKPIIISKIGVSHFSTENNTYQINLASEKISEFYNVIFERYPRIKGIVYFNNSNLGFTTYPQNVIVNDYNIDTDNYIFKIYNDIITTKSTEVYKIRKEIFNSAFPGFVIAGETFISTNCLIYDLKLKSVDTIIYYINNVNCIKVENNFEVFKNDIIFDFKALSI